MRADHGCAGLSQCTLRRVIHDRSHVPVWRSCVGLSHATEGASLLVPLGRVIHGLICQLLCGAKRFIVILVSPHRALVRRAVGVYRAGGHSRGARTALLLVVLLLAVLLYAATVTVLWPPQPCPSYLPYAAERRRTLCWACYPEIVRLLRLAHLATAGAAWAVLSWVLCPGWPELPGTA